MTVYHVVTERPMLAGTRIVFDDTHHSGVYERVYSRADIVKDIYSCPEKYDINTLDHHTKVALRELALEEVRKEKYPFYPSRLACLYVSKTYEEAEQWADYFVSLGRPTFSIVKLNAEGRVFYGDASRCFDGTTDKYENLRLAEYYWSINQTDNDTIKVRELLVDGEIIVEEIVKVINANIME